MNKATLSRLAEITDRIYAFQMGQRGGSAVSLDVLKANAILSVDDCRFFADHGIVYRPTAAAELTGQMFSYNDEGEQGFFGPVADPAVLETWSLADVGERLRPILHAGEFFLLEVGDRGDSISVNGDILNVYFPTPDFLSRSSLVKNIVPKYRGVLIRETPLGSGIALCSRISANASEVIALVQEVLACVFHLSDDQTVKVTRVGVAAI